MCDHRLGWCLPYRHPENGVARRARTRYIASVPDRDEYTAMSAEEACDRRDFAWTARDALGSALDDLCRALGKPVEPKWWDTYDGRWPNRRLNEHARR